jgi:hypothetical protein
MSETFSKTVPVDGVRGQRGNLFLGILAGIMAAAVGAAIWMGITIATGMHIGYVALGVGALVGFAIRLAGNGTTVAYGIVGAICTLLGCLGGEVLTVIQSATTPQLSFFDVLTHVDLTQLIPQILSNASPITYLIYGIGIFEGYKLSIKN